jgi:hypothetical protein
LKKMKTFPTYSLLKKCERNKITSVTFCAQICCLERESDFDNFTIFLPEKKYHAPGVSTNKSSKMNDIGVSKKSVTRSVKRPRSANWGGAHTNAGRKQKKLSTLSPSQAAPALMSPVNSVGPAGPSTLWSAPAEPSNVPTVSFFAPRFGIHQSAIPMGLSNDINLMRSDTVSPGDDGGMGNANVALHGDSGTSSQYSAWYCQLTILLLPRIQVCQVNNREFGC